MRMRNAARSLGPVLAVVSVVAALAAGCSGNESPTGPGGLTTEDADDIALQASISVATLGAIVEGSAGDGGGSPAPGSFRLSRVGPSPAGGVVPDTTFTVGGVLFELHRSWFDQGGTEQSAPDSGTDSIHVTSRVTGSAATPGYEVAVGHAGQVGIGGLHPSRSSVWINGACADTLVSHFTAIHRPVERWFVCRTSSDIDDVVWVKPSGTTTYPGSGTITMTLTAVSYRDGAYVDVVKTVNATVVVQFNGTRTPLVTVNGVWMYLLDLDTGTITRPGAV